MPGIFHIFRSLLVTAVISFLLPVFIIGSLFLLLTAAQQLTVIAAASQISLSHMMNFLAVLGSGNPWQGCLVVGLASCLVGVLFDTFALYRYQTFRHHQSH